MSWWCNSYSSKVYVQVWLLPLSSGVSVRKLNIFFWFLFVFVWFGFVFWGWGLGRVVLWLLLKIQGYSNNKIYANKWCFDLGIIQCTMYHYNYVSGAEKIESTMMERQENRLKRRRHLVLILKQNKWKLILNKIERRNLDKIRNYQ